MLALLKELASMYIPSLGISDIIEIIILIFLIYKLIIGIRNTRVQVILKGILVLFLFYAVAYIFKFDAILVLFQSAITLCLFAIIVVFQPELRKFLEQMGTKNITGSFKDIFSLFKKDESVKKYYGDKTITEIVKACTAMGRVKTGALIVIERNIPLVEYIESGVDINADISNQLYINIFEKNTPLHDGAVIQIGDKIKAATCYLPLSNNKKINKNLGTRHRAAIGISEVTDCLVIVVSEETGNISLAVNGKLKNNLNSEGLTKLLCDYQTPDETKVTEVVKDTFTLKKLNPKNLISKENFSIKIVSFLLAIVGWVFLINISNPMTTKTFTDVPIELINTQVIESTGKTFEITSKQYVDIKIKDHRSVVDRVKKEDIKVIADFTKLSYVNAVLLQGYVEGSSSTIVEFIDENTLTVELDSIISKEIVVTAEKYCSDDSISYVPILKPNISSVVVTGGKSVIDIIDKVVYTYDVTNAIGIYEGTSTPTVYDRNGDIIDNSLLTFSVDEIVAMGNSYYIKEIPINVTLNSQYIGNYKVGEMSFEPQIIKIAAEDRTLEKTDVLEIQLDSDIDISTMNNNEFIRSVNVSDYLPDGIYFVGDDDEVILTLKFESLKTNTLTFTKEEVSVVGLGNYYNAVIEDSAFDVTITGDELVLNSIVKENVKPYIDVTGLNVGKYNLIVQFDGLDNVILPSNVSVNLKIENKG